MEKNNKRIIVLGVIGIVIFIFGVVGITYAFFNYTRTGASNMIKTGRISFSTGQTDTINLTNLFPISSSEVATDNDNTAEVLITVTGDTTYSEGIEYAITAEDVHVTIGSGNNQKSVPVSLVVTPEKTGNIGTASSNYWNDRGENTSYYFNVANISSYYSRIFQSKKTILLGYIAPGETEVNGTIGIKAFINKNDLAISDTYNPTCRYVSGGRVCEETDENGTTVGWVNRRTVLTTEEWNTLSETPISFKIKVEANEGIWVPENVVHDIELTDNIYCDGYNLNTVVYSDDREPFGISISTLGPGGINDKELTFDDPSLFTFTYDGNSISPFHKKIIVRFLPENYGNVIDEPIVLEYDLINGIYPDPNNYSLEDFQALFNYISNNI